MSNSFWNAFEIKRQKESVRSSIKWLSVFWSILLLAMFLYVNVPGLEKQSSTFIFLAIASGFAIAFIELGSSKIKWDYNFMGKDQNVFRGAFYGLLFGGLIIFLGGQSIVGSLSIVNISEFFIALIVVGIFAPVFEEMIFRVSVASLIPFIFDKRFGLSKGFLDLSGIIFASFAWAFFHLSVLGTNPGFFYWLVLLGLSYSFLNQYVFKSTSFSLVAHLVNNLVFVFVTYGVLVM